jgi:hypothetical protein
VQVCVIAAGEGGDVNGTQLPALIAWVMIILYTYNGYVYERGQALGFKLIYRLHALDNFVIDINTLV